MCCLSSLLIARFSGKFKFICRQFKKLNDCDVKGKGFNVADQVSPGLESFTF